MPDFTEPLYSIRVLLAEARDRSVDPIAAEMIDAAVELLSGAPMTPSTTDPDAGLRKLFLERNTLRRENACLRAALEEQQEAQRLIMEEVLPRLRRLIANGCVSTAVGVIDELAATWCGVETVDRLLARRALSDSPAPEVRDGHR